MTNQKTGAVSWISDEELTSLSSRVRVTSVGVKEQPSTHNLVSMKHVSSKLIACFLHAPNVSHGDRFAFDADIAYLCRRDAYLLIEKKLLKQLPNDPPATKVICVAYQHFCFICIKDNTDTAAPEHLVSAMDWPIGLCAAHYQFDVKYLDAFLWCTETAAMFQDELNILYGPLDHSNSFQTSEQCSVDMRY